MDHLALVLSTNPLEVLQEACQVLEKHGCPVKEMKGGLYCSSRVRQVVLQVLHYDNLIVVRAYTNCKDLCTQSMYQCCYPTQCYQSYTRRRW